MIVPHPPGKRASLASAPDTQNRSRKSGQRNSLPAARGGPTILAPTTRLMDSPEPGELSDGQGTPKAPARPARGSTQFDFNEGTSHSTPWGPSAAPGWIFQQPGFTPEDSRPQPVHRSSNPFGSPRRTSAGLAKAENMFSSMGLQQPVVVEAMYAQNGVEEALERALRNNPTPKVLTKQNRWGDGMGRYHSHLDLADEGVAGGIEAHPPPVYSTDGDGDGEEEVVAQPTRTLSGVRSSSSGRAEKLLSVNEEFKRRVLATLQEVSSSIRATRRIL